jgi:hypothetical protein
MSQELLSIKTRQVFRENMVGWVLREIADEFDAAKVDCDLSHQPLVSGQRRTLVEQYYHTVDWADHAQVRRVLQVFENVLHRAEKLAEEVTFTPEWQEQRKKEVEKLIHYLQRDGFQWLGGRIVSGAGIPSLASIRDTAVVFDANHMADQIRRMESAVESDPSLAIGTAKEIIETCCKTILAERGKPVTGTPDVSTLTKETLKELKLVPEGVPDAARGAEVIKRLLSNLGTIGNGLAELRGLYGTGHGKHGSTTGLGARHAKLAVGAAATLTVFLFETHKETKP